MVFSEKPDNNEVVIITLYSIGHGMKITLIYDTQYISNSFWLCQKTYLQGHFSKSDQCNDLTISSLHAERLKQNRQC